MSFHKAMMEMKYDVRLIEFGLSSGELTKEELKQRLDSLPDLAPNTEPLMRDQSGQSTGEENPH